MAAKAERASARATELRDEEQRPRRFSTAWRASSCPMPRARARSAAPLADERARRRRKRDGVDNGMAMLALQRSEILRDDDEFALVAERDALAAAGIAPAGDVRAARCATKSTRRSPNSIARCATPTSRPPTLTVELKLGEGAIPELAPIEEDVERLRDEIEQLEAFDRALALAARDRLAAHARSAPSLRPPARNVRRRCAAHGHRRALPRDRTSIPRRSS